MLQRTKRRYFAVLQTSKMTEDSSLPVVMTTTGMTQITGGSTMASSSSRGTELYLYCALVVIGVVGTVTNALILYAMVASKQHNKQVLIFNQNVLDFFSSFFMVVTNSIKLCDIYLTGSVGYWLCVLLLNDCLVWWGTNGSVTNLVFITVERYLKVVHPVWSKNKLRNWMIYLAVAFSWISGVIVNAIGLFPISEVVDGTCNPFVTANNETYTIIILASCFLPAYVVVLSIFVFCYWRILIIIRRQARVMAAHDAAGPTAAQTTFNQIQSNIVKTMILVSALYAVSWLPMDIYLSYAILNPNSTSYGGYHATMSIAFLHVCTNPFIYATKFDPVKEVLLQLITCKK